MGLRWITRKGNYILKFNLPTGVQKMTFIYIIFVWITFCENKNFFFRVPWVKIPFPFFLHDELYDPIDLILALPPTSLRKFWRKSISKTPSLLHFFLHLYINVDLSSKELIYYFTYFSTIVPSNICVFLSCRPFVINTTFQQVLWVLKFLLAWAVDIGWGL